MTHALTMTLTQQKAIKAANDKLILEQGYRINEWLPILDDSKIRSLEEIKGRISIMNAVINIAFEAPTHEIKNWIIKHKLTKYLSESEQLIIDKPNDHLNNFELNSVMWYLESLWALMWVVEMIDTLDAKVPVGDNMAQLLPDLENEEDNSKVDEATGLRSELEIYTMLDYYYRLHWYVTDSRINGVKIKLTDGVIYERRKALEWVFNRDCDWDSVEMGV
jgi:Domain of unknown function (DUF4272)